MEYDGVNTPVNTQLIDSDLSIASLGVDRDNELYFLAFDGKIYRFQSTIVTSVNDNRVTVTEYFIGQNYPNPFNPETNIRIVLPESGKIEVAVRDIRGRMTKQLYNGYKQTGDHVFTWEGTNESGKAVASGIYFFSIMITGTQKTFARKMLLIR